MVDCCVGEFGEGGVDGGGDNEVWRESLKRRLERESFLRDIVGDDDDDDEKRDGDGDIVGDGDGDRNGDGEAKKEKKRKRKKKKKKEAKD